MECGNEDRNEHVAAGLDFWWGSLWDWGGGGGMVVVGCLGKAGIAVGDFVYQSEVKCQ